MAKSNLKLPSKRSVKRHKGSKTKPALAPLRASTVKSGETASKQSRVIALLQSTAGTTIDAMIKVTGWQKHTVRSFLTGVVRKKLKLMLTSDKVDGKRIYRVAAAQSPGNTVPMPKRRAA